VEKVPSTKYQVPSSTFGRLRAKQVAHCGGLISATSTIARLPESFPTADIKCDFVSAILPFVKGKTSGETIKLQAAHCSPEVKFDWGTK